MSGLLSSLAQGVKALTAQSFAVETAGRNLANVNNPNYARQRIVFGDRGSMLTTLGAQSLGLEARAVQQVRDALRDRQVIREVALMAELRASQNAYQKAQAALGQKIDRTQAGDAVNASQGGAGIAESLSDFFNAFESFAARPTDPGERQVLLQKAGILVDRINWTDARLTQLQDDLDAQIASDVEAVNRLLGTIADLNGQIGRLEVANPGSAVDLRDQRQARLEELSQYMSFETRPATGAPGQIDLFVRDASQAEVPLVNLTAVTGPVSFDGTQLSGGAPATPIALAGGSIKGTLAARDGGIQDLRDDLDALAHQLVSAVNAAYNPSATPEDFFAPGGITAGSIALAGGLSVSSLKASDGGAAGDTTLARAVADLANHKFSLAGSDVIEGTFSQHYARSVSGLGQTLASVNARLEDQTSIEQLVRSQRDAVSAVSMDEEVADLLKYQRSFQASSRVIQVIDELLDVVVNNLVRR